MILSKRIALTRVGQNISQELLSFRADIPLSIIEKIENGFQLPDYSDLQKIATALDLEIEPLQTALNKSKNIALDIKSSKTLKKITFFSMLASPIPLISTLICVYFLINNKNRFTVWIIGKRVANFQLYWGTFSILLLIIVASLQDNYNYILAGLSFSVFSITLMIYLILTTINLLFLVFTFLKLHKNLIRVYN